MTPQLTLTQRLQLHLETLEKVSTWSRNPTIHEMYRPKIDQTRKCLEERKRKRRK